MADRRGIITSPNYPNTYAENLDCEWKIYVGKTETITIQFIDFYIDYSLYGTIRCLGYLLVSMFILVCSYIQGKPKIKRVYVFNMIFISQ